MRGLAILAGAVLLSSARVESATRPIPAAYRPSPKIRTVDWCNHTYPWSGGPLTAVKLSDCAATYQEALLDPPGDFAAWTWGIVDPVRYENDRVAIVTLQMRQTMTGKPDDTFRRTYWFRWDGRAPALVRADPVVMVP